MLTTPNQDLEEELQREIELSYDIDDDVQYMGGQGEKKRNSKRNEANTSTGNGLFGFFSGSSIKNETE